MPRTSSPSAAADDPNALGGCRVAAGLGPGEREAGDLLAAREARQVVALLLVGSVVEQQLARSERVGNHDRHRHGDAAAGQLGDDGGVGDGREAQAAVLLGDDHAEEAVPAQEGPDLLGQIAALRDLPVVEHRAELLDGTVEEGLLRRRELAGREGEQLAPVGPA
jgi:hypothetical protein